MDDVSGLSLRELVLEVRNDVKALDDKVERHVEFGHTESRKIEHELGKRPTRAEVISLLVAGLTGASVLFAGLSTL